MYANTVTREVGDECEDAVAECELLRPVPRGRRGHPVHADVLERAALPALALMPQVRPGRHEFGPHPTTLRVRPCSRRASSSRSSVRCPQSTSTCRTRRRGVPGSTDPRAAATAPGRRHETASPCRSARRPGPGGGRCRVRSGGTRCAAAEPSSPGASSPKKTPPTASSSGRASNSATARSMKSSTMTVSASITKTASNGPNVGSNRASSWLSPPALR